MYDPRGIEDYETVEVLAVDQVGAGSTPLLESRIRGKRKVRAVRGAKPTDRFLCAPILGDSLRDDGILTGDLAILKTTFERHEIKDGQLVAVRCPAGNIIKHFFHEAHGVVRLASANDDYPDLYFDEEDVEIEAVVVRTERVIEWV